MSGNPAPPPASPLPRRRRLIGLYRPEVPAEKIVADVVAHAGLEPSDPPDPTEPSTKR